MARFEFKQDPPPEHWTVSGHRAMNLAARGFGMVLMVVGLIVALTVIVSAWSLYDDPARIDGFARAVERGSHIDRALDGSGRDQRQQLDATERGTDAPRLASEAAVGGNGAPEVSFAYFVAWLLAVLLLFLLGTLAIAAVRTGGELVLYDAKLNRLAREIIAEIARRKD